MPGPINSQRRRSLGRPSANRGYQPIGTDTLRPSRNWTTSACSVTLTWVAAAVSIARLEVLMPCLQQLGVVFLHQRRNPVQLVRGKSQGVLQPHGLQPELGGLAVARHMDVRWLAPVARKEEEPIWATLEDRRTHGSILPAFRRPCQTHWPRGRSYPDLSHSAALRRRSRSKHGGLWSAVSPGGRLEQLWHEGRRGSASRAG